MSQPRHKRKNRGLAAHNGRVVHVTRCLPTGEVVEYDAILQVEIDEQQHVGRVLLERIKFLHACARVGAYAMFNAAMDAPIEGFPEWFRISGHYSVINRHTQGRTYTRAVMDHLTVWGR